MRRKRLIPWAATISAALVFSCSALVLETPAVAAGASNAAQSAPDPDERRLFGRWVRLDGGYVLSLKGIGKDGSLDAAYFNPRSINVARAELTRKDGTLMVYIELRDINYPGSRYRLQYDSASDRLKGTYFQAVEKQTFEVEFARAK